MLDADPALAPHLLSFWNRPSFRIDAADSSTTVYKRLNIIRTKVDQDVTKVDQDVGCFPPPPPPSPFAPFLS